MSATSPGAYGLSALMHGAVAGLILFFSYAATTVVKDSPTVLELVAGEGDNYAATAAPALGSPGGVKLRVPATVLPPTPPTPKAETSPIQSAPEETVPPPKPTKALPAKPIPAKPTVPKTDKPVDLVASLKRAEIRREKKLEAKYQKEKEAEQRRITQEQFQRQQTVAKAGGHISHIDTEGIRQGVVGGSTENKTGGAGGKALTREESDALDAYLALLKARIKENHEPLEGVSDNLVARVEFFLAADGSLSRFRIIKSSGNREFDASVVAAGERTHSIGARPDGRSEMLQMNFKQHEDDTP